MTQPVRVPPPGFDDLPVDEQIDYVQSLWDRITAHADQVPVPDWHKRILEERLEQYRNAPEEAIPWREVQDQIRKNLSNLGR